MRAGVEGLDDALGELTGDVVDHHQFAVHPPHATRRRRRRRGPSAAALATAAAAHRAVVNDEMDDEFEYFGPSGRTQGRHDGADV